MMFPERHFPALFFPSNYFFLPSPAVVPVVDAPAGGGFSSSSNDGGLYDHLLREDEEILAIIISCAKGIYL